MENSAVAAAALIRHGGLPSAEAVKFASMAVLALHAVGREQLEAGDDEVNLIFDKPVADFDAFIESLARRESEYPHQSASRADSGVALADE